MLSNTSTSEPSSPHSAFSGLESLSIHDRDTVDRAASVDPAPVDSLADLIEEAHETGDHAALIAWREAEVQKARSEAFAACLSFAIGDDRPKLALYALAFAIGAPEIQGLSLRKLASLCGVTPAAFSKRVRQIVETFGIQSRGIRSEQATRHYRLARVRRLILVRSARMEREQRNDHSQNRLSQDRQEFGCSSEESPVGEAEGIPGQLRAASAG